MKEFCVAAFASTHLAMQAEKGLGHQLPVQLMPTPRQITASCGISLQLPPQMAKTAEKLLWEQFGAEGWELYLLEENQPPRHLAP